MNRWINWFPLLGENRSLRETRLSVTCGAELPSVFAESWVDRDRWTVLSFPYHSCRSPATSGCRDILCFFLPVPLSLVITHTHTPICRNTHSLWQTHLLLKAPCCAKFTQPMFSNGELPDMRQVHRPLCTNWQLWKSFVMSLIHLSKVGGNTLTQVFIPSFLPSLLLSSTNTWMVQWSIKLQVFLSVVLWRCTEIFG